MCCRANTRCWQEEQQQGSAGWVMRLMGLMDVHEIPATSVKYKLATRLRYHILT